MLLRLLNRNAKLSTSTKYDFENSLCTWRREKTLQLDTRIPLTSMQRWAGTGAEVGAELYLVHCTSWARITTNDVLPYLKRVFVMARRQLATAEDETKATNINTQSTFELLCNYD